MSKQAVHCLTARLTDPSIVFCNYVHTTGPAAEAPPHKLQRAHVFMYSCMHRASQKPIHRHRPVVLVYATPLERPRAVGGKPKRAGNNKLELCTWAKLAVIVEVKQSAACPWRSRDASACDLRKHCASGLRAPQGIRTGALRHKQLHAGRGDRPAVLVPGQGLARTERLQR